MKVALFNSIEFINILPRAVLKRPTSQTKQIDSFWLIHLGNDFRVMATLKPFYLLDCMPFCFYVC